MGFNAETSMVPVLVEGLTGRLSTGPSECLLHHTTANPTAVSRLQEAEGWTPLVEGLEFGQEAASVALLF